MCECQCDVVIICVLTGCRLGIRGHEDSQHHRGAVSLPCRRRPRGENISEPAWMLPRTSNPTHKITSSHRGWHSENLRCSLPKTCSVEMTLPSVFPVRQRPGRFWYVLASWATTAWQRPSTTIMVATDAMSTPYERTNDYNITNSHSHIDTWYNQRTC